MKETSAQRTAKYRAKLKDKGLKVYSVLVTDKERDVIKPIIDKKLKELRATESKK